MLVPLMVSTVSMTRLVVKTAVGLVKGWEKVLDLGGGLDFMKSDGVDQNRWIRQGIGAPVQLGKSSAGRRDRLEDRPGLRLRIRRKVR